MIFEDIEIYNKIENVILNCNKGMWYEYCSARIDIFIPKIYDITIKDNKLNLKYFYREHENEKNELLVALERFIAIEKWKEHTLLIGYLSYNWYYIFCLDNIADSILNKIRMDISL